MPKVITAVPKAVVMAWLRFFKFNRCAKNSPTTLPTLNQPKKPAATNASTITNMMGKPSNPRPQARIKTADTSPKITSTNGIEKEVSRPTAPLASGFLRSLQFTSLNAIAYADVDQARMSQASSLAAMAQQIALALGVTLGGYALSMAGALTGRPDAAAINFTFAFLTVGLVSLASTLQMRRLARDAGAEMAGRAQPGREVAEQKPEPRAQT